MIDIKTGRIIDMIEGRDGEKLVSWLKTYPNVEYVSRDGSQTYANAITKALPNAQQISDRFHIVKNLYEAVIKHFQHMMKGRIEIPITSKAEEIISVFKTKYNKRERILKVHELYREGNTQVDIVVITGCSKATIKKYLSMKESDIPKESTDVRGELHLNTTERVAMKVQLCKELKEQGKSINRIAKETGIYRGRVCLYLSEDFSPVHAQYGQSRHGKLEKYRDTVVEMRNTGKTYGEIANHISALGYTGSVATLRVFMQKERRLTSDFQSQSTTITELIKRNWLIKLLFKPIEQVKGITTEQLNEVIKLYPILQTLYLLVSEFKEIMFSKKPHLLLNWIIYAQSLEITEITSFTNGLLQDFDAVENAIALSYNNGLAEGNINKIKLIKRVMFGRSSFDTLRHKILLLENRKFN